MLWLWGSTVTILIIGRVSWNQLCVRVRKKKILCNMVCILGADMISVASNIHWPFSMLQRRC